MGMESSDWVQPILVRLADSHTEAVEASAVASVLALVRDLPSIDPDGRNAWDTWLSGQFIKTVRRVKRFPEVGAYAEHTRGGTTARAYAPVRYEHLPKSIAKAQVQGTDITPHDMPYWEGRTGQHLLLRESLALTTGKAAAQAAHALMTITVRERVIEGQWPAREVLEAVSAAQVSDDLLFSLSDMKFNASIHDAGKTEIESGTMTALGLPLD